MVLALFLSAFAMTAAADDGVTFDHGVFDALLRKRVTRGRVDYAALLKSRKALSGYLIRLGKADWTKLATRAEKFAFWINAYNACTLEGVLNTLPADPASWAGYSVVRIKGFWKKQTYRVSGKLRTLDEIEHKLLRPVFKDARLHMAIVCASTSCPPLRSEAYTGQHLERQLDQQTRQFVADRTNVQIDVAARTLRLNQLFNWFKKDFGGVPQFLARHVSQAKTRTALERGNWKVSYSKYDWSLNAIKRK